jgi:hypothetical protein
VVDCRELPGLVNIQKTIENGPFIVGLWLGKPSISMVNLWLIYG